MNQLERLERQLCAPRTVLRAWLLLLVYDRPAHGYDLLARLADLGCPTTPSRVYRALQELNATGLVEPGWETTGSGPARRVSTLTPAGHRALEVLEPALQARARSLSRPMARQVLLSLRAVATQRRSSW